MEELAPELLPALVGYGGDALPAANFVPLTNSLLAELQRRGVSRDQLLSTLQKIGSEEMPAATMDMLRLAASRQVCMRYLHLRWYMVRIVDRSV